MDKQEFLKKYEGKEVEFVEYWKHKFMYKATIDGHKITVWLGDKDDDIYRSGFERIEIIEEYNLMRWQIDDGEIFDRWSK